MRGWILALLAAAGTLQAQDQDLLRSYFGRAPVLDGVIGPSEWADASEFTGVKDWLPAFHPVTDDRDLSLKGYVKHDNEWLYFGMDVTDDLLYGIETPRFVPETNPKAHDLTREGYPWYGDEAEILIDTTGRAGERRGVLGDGTSWQMVCNLTKSRGGGVGAGGILEGEPRAREEAWILYQRWLRDGVMKCAAARKPGDDGYVLEWAIRFNPCLELAPARYYSPADGEVEVALKIALGDLDTKERGSGNRFHFHHEQWFPPARDAGEGPASGGRQRPWGRLRLMGSQVR